MRKLASVQKIKAIDPIPGADNIEVATILGWHVVVKKGEFKPGDLCVYIEIDSILPDKPEFEFMAKRKFRVKTARMRGQISQGIAFHPKDVGLGRIKEDQDVTDKLGITKYEPNPDNVGTNNKSGKVRRRNWPQFLVKTDETRIQGMRDRVIEQMVGTKMYVSEKLDGSSMTVFVKGDEFGVCSRNLMVYSSKWLELNWYQKLAVKFPRLRRWINVPTFDPKSHFVQAALKIEERMRTLQKDNNYDFAVQGEIIGPGIQKNKYNLKDFEFWIFNVYNITKKCFCDFYEMQAVSLRLNTQHVPILHIDFEFLPQYGSDYFVDLSIGKSVLNKNVQREGIVVRSMEEKDIIGHGRCSFKAINPKFLLKYDE